MIRMIMLATFANDAADESSAVHVRSVAGADDSPPRNDIAVAGAIAVDGSALVVLGAIGVVGRPLRVLDAVSAKIEFDLPVAAVSGSRQRL